MQAVILCSRIFLYDVITFCIWRKSHSVLLTIGQYSKSNLAIYNLRMFGKIIFVMIVKYDVTGILATRLLEKCDRTVFEIVNLLIVLRQKKMGLPSLPDCYSNFMVYRKVLFFCKHSKLTFVKCYSSTM